MLQSEFPLPSCKIKLKKYDTVGNVLKFATICEQPGVSSFIRLEVMKVWSEEGKNKVAKINQKDLTVRKKKWAFICLTCYNLLIIQLKWMKYLTDRKIFSSSFDVEAVRMCAIIRLEVMYF